MVGPLNLNGTPPPQWMVEGGFNLRYVREADREAILALTAHTWEHGDYIAEVFDRWVAEPEGVFALLEHTATGQVAALDKVTFAAPGQAWFEGLRVNPEYRGRGLSGLLQTHMIGVARALGARVVRFLTLTTNVPIHIAAYRDGFHIAALTRYWRWQASEDARQTVNAMPMRPARPDEAAAVRDWWLRTAAYPTGGLVHRFWTYYESDQAEWVAAAREGRLLVEAGADLGSAKVPPAAVMWTVGEDESAKWWQVAATLAQPNQWAPMFRALLDEAARRGIAEVDGMFPDSHDANTGLATAGLTPDPDDRRLILFELRLQDSKPDPPAAS